jgi:hypothetical protein
MVEVFEPASARTELLVHSQLTQLLNLSQLKLLNTDRVENTVHCCTTIVSVETCMFTIVNKEKQHNYTRFHCDGL